MSELLSEGQFLRLASQFTGMELARGCETYDVRSATCTPRRGEDDWASEGERGERSENYANLLKLFQGAYFVPLACFHWYVAPEVLDIDSFPF